MLTYVTRNSSLCPIVCDLFREIDAFLSGESKKVLNSVIYGEPKSKISGKFFILSQYRKILEMKCDNSRCVRQYDIWDIISNIKQYISSGTVQKISMKPKYSIISNELKEDVLREVHNHYHYNTYNAASDIPDNTFIVLNEGN